MNDQLIADLKATKARVQKGWCSSGFSDSDGNLCVLGCVCDVVGLVEDNLLLPEMNGSQNCRIDNVTIALEAHIPVDEHKPSRYARMNVAAYNDRETTLQADIENLIDKTLADLGGL